jgi:hypothetical protein
MTSLERGRMAHLFPTDHVAPSPTSVEHPCVHYYQHGRGNSRYRGRNRLILFYWLLAVVAVDGHQDGSCKSTCALSFSYGPCWSKTEPSWSLQVKVKEAFLVSFNFKVCILNVGLNALLHFKSMFECLKSHHFTMMYLHRLSESIQSNLMLH